MRWFQLAVDLAACHVFVQQAADTLSRVWRDLPIDDKDGELGDSYRLATFMGESIHVCTAIDKLLHKVIADGISTQSNNSRSAPPVSNQDDTGGGEKGTQNPPMG